MAQWIKKWEVESSSSDKFYTVSLATDGTYGCSCPVWRFRRQVCKHIVAIQKNQSSVQPTKPVPKPVPIPPVTGGYSKDGRLKRVVIMDD